MDTQKVRCPKATGVANFWWGEGGERVVWKNFPRAIFWLASTR